MTRKKFLHDLDRASKNPPGSIHDVQRYDGDGISFEFSYLHDLLDRRVKFNLIATNIDEYPDSNQFIFYTDEIEIDTAITNSMEQIQATLDGSSVFTALREISTSLHQTITLGQKGNPISLEPSSQPSCNSDTDEFDEYQDNDYNDDTSFGLGDLVSQRSTVKGTHSMNARSSSEHVEKIKLDLNAAKSAGYKIGVHGDLSRAGILCIAIRIAKLDLSDEAIRAWGLLRNDYLVLLIKFEHGYKPLEIVKEEAELGASVEMRVGLCNTYKPRFEEACAAFSQVDAATSTKATGQATQADANKTSGTLKPLFIGRPINNLLRKRFSKIVKFRILYNLPWSGAERLFNDRQGTLLSDLSKDLTSYRQPEPSQAGRLLPSVMMHDSLAQQRTSQASLPLVAMQFVLRHFVRCTEFCLVCHCRLQDTFEALKPYVCSNPLCLYQFLALGFGPAVEWEILSQPYVVDLLVSLCYLQTCVSRIKDFPYGMNIRVPILPTYEQALPTVYTSHHPFQHRSTSSKSKSSKPLSKPARVFRCTLDRSTNKMSVTPGTRSKDSVVLNDGDWIALVTTGNAEKKVLHCRIINQPGTSFTLNPVLEPTKKHDSSKPGPISSSEVLEADCYPYDTNFDELTTQYRHHAMKTLLEMIPPISELRQVLSSQLKNHRDADLGRLKSICPPASLDLLRWIIASNRSCIVQADNVFDKTGSGPVLQLTEDRVSGMDDWLQFRFAQGAPDKEQRFVDCVKNKSISTQYPTLFAWHGSPLYNWHSIIRQGLNFDETLHGRASGHGVYMSPFLATSMGYVGGHMSNVAGSTGSNWPNSSLDISAVVSLQEVVNAPASFVSQTPHFVVAEKDWIQTRYLFVKAGEMRHPTTRNPQHLYRQDPTYIVKGNKSETVSIPITAIAKSRRPSEAIPVTVGSKKRKTTPVASKDVDDNLSVATDDEDKELLYFSDDDPFDCDESDIVMYEPEPKLHFVPGSLDTSDIHFLHPPSTASVAATKALMRAFTETIRLQTTTPLHELGFYIDPDRIENMYQWIVELHSFEMTLPLAKDMQSAGVSSVVFEMRFPDDFPFSPPFIRVIKPRFLDPIAGGGGHITSGGAICMELLTSSGWSAVTSIENVLLQVRLSLCEQERPARLLQHRGKYNTSPYPIGEAIAAYKRFCLRHNWKIPAGLDSLAIE